MSSDDRTLDDDAPTPPGFERARSQSGEIEIPELPSRRARTQPAVESSKRPRYRQSDLERDTEGFRDHRKTGPIERIEDATPNEIDESEELSEPLADLPPDLDRVYKSLVRKLKRAADRTMQVEAAVVAAPPAPGRKLVRDLGVAVLTIIASSILALVFDGYRSARTEINDEHDHRLIDEQRIDALERTLGAVIVPRISPTLLMPGTSPGKDVP